MELIPDRSRKNTHIVFFACASCQGGFVPPECLDLRNLASPSHPAWGGSVVREMVHPGIAWKKRRVKNRNCFVSCGAQDPHLTVPLVSLESPRIHQAVNPMSRRLDRCGIGSLKDLVLSHVEVSKIDQTNTYITYKYHHSTIFNIFYYSVVVPVNSIGGVVVGSIGSFGSFGSFQTN